MLFPKKKTVLENTIKELPTKPIQVNSVNRLPHIRNQHIKDKALTKNHINKEENKQIIARDDEIVDYTTHSGKKIKLHIAQRKTYTNEIEMYKGQYREDALKENSKHFKETTFGYLEDNPEDMSEVKINSKFFNDFGIDKFIDNLNFGEDALFSLSFLVSAQEQGKGLFSFDLKYRKETNPAEIQKDELRKKEENYIQKQASLHSAVRIDNKNSTLINNIHYIRAQGPEVKSNTGTQLHIDLMKNNKKMAVDSNVSNVKTLIDAGLTTGPYLWPECGYLVSEGARSDYIFDISKNSRIMCSEISEHAVEKYKALHTSNQIKELNNKFMETGDVDFIKQKSEIEYNNIPELHSTYKTPTDYYKESLKPMLFSAYFNFSVNDTPETNIHLSKLNKRSLKVFGKSLSI